MRGASMKVFVLGASSAIGQSVCKKYLAEGWSVLAHYNRSKAALDAIEALAGNNKFSSMRIAFDDPAELEARLSELKSCYLTCNAMVNCAATIDPLAFSEITAKNILTHMATNLIPGLLIMRDLGPVMAERGWGRIVQLGSIGTKFGGGQQSFSYALSKHAMEMLPQESKFWAERNVLLNVLRVGVTDTSIHRSDPTKDMTERVALIPMKRMASPTEIAEAVWFLGSEKNTFITGQSISISGGE